MQRSPGQWIDDHAAFVLLTPAVVLLIALVYHPALSSVWNSLHGQVLSLPGRGAPFVGLDNYRDLLATPVFWRALRTTLLFATVSVAAELAIGLAIALCLDGLVRGRGVLRAAVLVPWAIPTVVASQMWRFLWNDRYGPLAYYLFRGDTPLASPSGALATIIVADVWKAAPFVALILLAGLQAIPESILQAARIDGACPWIRSTRITLPLLKPALVAAFLFRMIDAFRVFDLVFVMTQGRPADGTDTLQFLGYRRSFAEGLIWSGAAISTAVFLITLSAALLYLRAVDSELWRGERR